MSASPDGPSPAPPPEAHLLRVGESFVAHDAVVCGAVELGRGTSVWYGCVVRGDCDRITIGEMTNVQDLTMVHADTGVPNDVGAWCTIGHRAVLHGRRIGDLCLIGIGAILLGGCEIGDGSIIGAGAVVTENAVIPPRSLVLGVPGRVVRTLDTHDVEERRAHASHYHELALSHVRLRD